MPYSEPALVLHPPRGKGVRLVRTSEPLFEFIEFFGIFKLGRFVAAEALEGLSK
jgi:hypothetical protein